MPAAVRALEEMGVRALIDDDWSAPFEGIRYYEDDGRFVEGHFPHGQGLGVRRIALAKALTHRAREVGVTILDECEARGFKRKADGVVLDTAQGPIEAKLLVAADGLQSPIRRAEGLERATPARGSGRARRFGIRRHFAIAPWCRFVEIHLNRGVEAYVTPAGRQRVGVALLWTEGHVEPSPTYEALLARFSVLSRRLAGAPVDSKPRGAGPFLRPVGRVIADRLVLIGDAAGYVDAITGEGMAIAFQCAQALAAILPEVLARGADAASLDPYARVHRRHYRQYEILTKVLVAVAPHPMLRRALFWDVFTTMPGSFEFLLGWLGGRLD